MRKLLVATRNRGKVREYQELLRGLLLELTWLDAEGISLEPEETGTTCAENAVLKAQAYAAASGLLTWADDSALEVDTLGGAPGVHSSRYAGAGASDDDRYRLLLRNLEGVPWEKRTARFRCVVAIVEPGGALRTAEGTYEGIVAFSPRGDNGFGYDPVFYLPDRQCTMAELAPAVKNQISHRARAVRAILPKIQEHLSKS